MQAMLSFFIEPSSSSVTLKLRKSVNPWVVVCIEHTTLQQVAEKEVKPLVMSSLSQRIHASKLGHLRIWSALPSTVATTFC